MSVPTTTVRAMTTSVHKRSEWWSKGACQVYARLGGSDGPIIFLPDGAADESIRNDPCGRTFRDLVTAGELWCPVEGCQAFKTVVQGAETRSHFRHRPGSVTDDDLHRGGPESIWHLQAKLAVHDWLAVAAAGQIRTLEIEYRDLPLLPSREGWRPDVYAELNDGARVAFECQLQSMASTSRKNTADNHDGRPEWERRLENYEALRESFGIHVVWLVSPWMAKGVPRLTRNREWRQKIYGTDAAGLLKAGQQLYWIDPAFNQIGTLVDHVGPNDDTRGFLTPARRFPYRQKEHWLHSDDIVECQIDSRTGVVTTPTDRKVEQQKPIAEERARIEAARKAELQRKIDEQRAEIDARRKQWEAENAEKSRRRQQEAAERQLRYASVVDARPAQPVRDTPSETSSFDVLIAIIVAGLVIAIVALIVATR